MSSKWIILMMVFLFSVGTSEGVWSQEEYKDRSYAYHRKIGEAKKLLFEKKYHAALKAYKEGESLFGRTLATIVGLGELFFRLGDEQSARTHFLEAASKKELENSEWWSLVQYRLAILSFNRGEEENFVSFLEKIVERNEETDEVILSIGVSRGIDEMISLYVIKPTAAFEALRELGLYYVVRGEKSKGASYTFTALAMAVHWGISDLLRSSRPKFRFTDVHYFVETMRKTKEGREFLAKTHMERMIRAIVLYFASEEYKKLGKSRHAMPMQKRYVQDILTMVSTTGKGTIEDGFEYYPMIHL